MTGTTVPRKVIVAVHGIGDQTRYATVQQVLAQFARYHGRAAAVPLGSFHAQGDSVVFTPRNPQEISDLGFTEVYWADIPRRVVAEKYLLEDTQAWVRTIIGRIHQRQEQILPSGAVPLTPADERMIEQVLREMLQTIGVLERLCFLAEKAGLFSFDLKKILVDFVNDVQIVAEFKKHGGEIGDLFAKQMQAVYEELEGVEEIYLVAHSEGTVVTLLGLLSAVCSGDKPWISKVRGLMTLGSPIDKHLILWPELFENFKEPCEAGKPPQPIEWHNYYDYGDPVGFELDTARERFTQGAWQGVFDFEEDHDHGFARYPLPGKAHVDYWEDEDVFGHFIRNVVYKQPPRPGDEKYKEPPRSKTLARIVSWVAPYVGAAVLLFCAVLILDKAVNGFLQTPPQEVGKVFFRVGSITCLLAGLTVLARIPRLTRMWRWRLFGFVFFLASIAGYRLLECIPQDATSYWSCVGIDRMPRWTELGLAGTAIGLAIAIYFASKLFPGWGMRALLVPGAFAVAYVVFSHIQGVKGDLWPVFLAGAAFLYLWWLVALVFDLTFVWHRYIRMSTPILEYRRRPLKVQGGQALQESVGASG
jgi:hypothetical protein